ncbi:MAG TPA: glycosyltransferase [Geminicoccus sp.]|uniref:glycosyltransferase n=1 Tax=Geminicoccus sp. TaxID=2024832 RepID=UPI002BC881DB|nr:glycosyltransferase [Geminicoccus sp.]HWL67268.1 glycosyltransferase [Geminicoccus sp.]
MSKPSLPALDPAGLKVAIVHDWLHSLYGSERVVEQILACFPQAELFTLVDVMPKGARGLLEEVTVHTSFIQNLPFARRHFRHYLPLMPLAIEQFDLSRFDLVLSSSHAFAKGVLTTPHQLHLAYVHAPMRYAWEYQHQYLAEAGLDRGLRSWLLRWQLHRLRNWDFRTGAGPDRLIANSEFIRQRIRRIYRRDAAVIHPPVRLQDFAPAPRKGDHFIAISRFAPYKRTELICAAFAAMPDLKLKVIGEGAGRARVRPAPNVELLGTLPRAEVARLLAEARALVFAAEEDFGITLVEAQAAGTPVIAYGRGGALDSIRPAPLPDATGLFFTEQSEGAICQAVRRFLQEESRFTQDALLRNAARFSEESFRERYLALVAAALDRHQRRGSGSSSAR